MSEVEVVSSTNSILEYLQDQQTQMVDVLRALVEQESPSRNKVLNDQLGSQIASLFEELTGGKATIIPNETYGNHVRGEWGEGEEQVLMLAHFDTVWPQKTLEEMPFRIEDGKAYGPGIFDMKGGLVQGLFALHALQALGQEIGSKVVFLFTSDEEIGSPTSRALIETEAKKSKCVIVLEPSMSPNAGLKTARKGVGMFKLKVLGVPVHAGIDHEKGRSAIEELARQISYLHNLTDYSTGTTINVGVISGGTTSNVVAAQAQADVDLRVVTQAEADRIVPLILGIKPQLEGTRVEITGGLNRPPMERTERVAVLYETAKRIARETLGFDLAEAATGGGSDGNFTAPLAPTLDGLGAVGAGAHAKHEHLIVAEMPVRSTLVALLLQEIASQPISSDFSKKAE